VASGVFVEVAFASAVRVGTRTVDVGAGRVAVGRARASESSTGVDGLECSLIGVGSCPIALAVAEGSTAMTVEVAGRGVALGFGFEAGAVAGGTTRIVCELAAGVVFGVGVAVGSGASRLGSSRNTRSSPAAACMRLDSAASR
jgi:hypothetical protein